LFVVTSSRYIWPLKRFPKSLRALCIWGMEVTLCEHLVKTICIQWRSIVIISWVAWGVGTINYGAWYILLVRGQTYKTIIVFTTVDMSCIIKKIKLFFSIKVLACIPPAYFQCPLVQKKERKVLNYTSTCMLNVHSTFICSYTLWFIVEHLCSEEEVPLHISFACCCSLNFESLILCTSTCYIQSSNKLQNPCLVLSPSYSRKSMG
jgi:hypothetical protein